MMISTCFCPFTSRRLLGETELVLRSWSVSFMLRYAPVLSISVRPVDGSEPEHPFFSFVSDTFRDQGPSISSTPQLVNLYEDDRTEMLYGICLGLGRFGTVVSCYVDFRVHQAQLRCLLWGRHRMRVSFLLSCPRFLNGGALTSEPKLSYRGTATS